MDNRVAVDFQNHVAHVRLVRPERLNAIDVTLLEQLVATGDKVAALPGLRAIVLSGEGRGFCSGIDTSTLPANPGDPFSIDIATPIRGAANLAQYAVLQWRDAPVPVIAAIHGFAFGGGFQLPLAADIRLVHPDTQMSLMELKWGLIPDMGGMALLKPLLPRDVLADLMFTARVFDGREAVSLGIATRVAEDPVKVALELAREIASRSPDAVRSGKRLLRIIDEQADSQILSAEAAEQMVLLKSANHFEAVAAGRAKRSPSFRD
ncbi:MAG: crotonase/enoyl-CoA hydratase family protein [Panacagrimonas sp.]